MRNQIILDTGPLVALLNRRDQYHRWARDQWAQIAPLSLADGCIVRLAERHARGVVFTLDNDFSIYRKNGRQLIPILAPAP